MSRTGGVGAPGGTRSRRHCVKYVKWEHIERWKTRVRAAATEEHVAYPYAYGSRDKAFLGFEGTVLWLMTLPRYDEYLLAPSIVARLQIDRVSTWPNDAAEIASLGPEVLDSGTIVAVAETARSHYLPLNNAFHLLMRLRFTGAAPALADSYARRDRAREGERGPYGSLAGHFQRHRWLDEESIEYLEDYATAVLDGRRAFLSYRRGDFPFMDGAMSWPAALGNALSEHRVSCWWDRWFLPQEDQAEPRMPKALLKAFLDDAVAQAAWFVALVGPGYLNADDDSWPRQEWVQSREQLGRDGRRHPMNRVTVFMSDPVDDELHRRWQEEGDTVLWTGPDPVPDDVAQMLLRLMSKDRSQ